MPIDLTNSGGGAPKRPPQPAAPRQLPPGWTVSGAALDAVEGRVSSPFGQLPLPAGQPLHLAPDEEALLTKLGWEPGEPVPVQLDAYLANLRQSARAAQVQLPPGVDPNQRRVVYTEVALDSLPAEQQAKIRRDVRAMIEAAGVAGPALADTSGLAPGVAEAVRMGTDSLAGPVLVDDVDEPAPTPSRQAPVGNDGPAPSATGLELKLCPHCGWDLDREDTVRPTDEERRQYLAVLWGGRFRKTYELYGGALKLTFRTLTTAEVDAITTQLFVDQRRGGILNAADLGYESGRYRLVASLERVEKDGLVAHDCQPVSEVPWPGPGEDDDPRQTVLPTLRKYYDANVWPTEMLFSVVQEAFRRFASLVSKLCDGLDDPNFSTGIPSRR